MSYSARTLLLLLLLLLGGLCLAGVAAASPSPAPTATPNPTPTPASAEVRAAALLVRGSAARQFAQYRRAMACFGRQTRVRLLPRPERMDDEAAWLRRMDEWREQGAWLRLHVSRLLVQMKKPGGPSNGVRWIPLMLWCHIPRGIVHTFAAIVMRESSGRERALNPSSGAAGICQWMPQWYRGQWGYPAFNPFKAEPSLKAAAWLIKRNGLQAWAL